MNWLSQLLSETDGNPSTMRFATMIIVLAVMANWTYLTIHTGQMQNLTPEQLGLLLGTLGIKAFQRKAEQPPDAPASNPTTPNPKP